MVKDFTLILMILLTVSCKDQKFPENSIRETVTTDKTEIINDTINNILRVENPIPGQLISSPLDITGEARGFWFFEAEATVELLDENMNKISRTNTTATGEWMTEDWVPFSGIIIFEKPATKNGYLVMHKANASGLKKHEMSDTITVKFRR